MAGIIDGFKDVFTGEDALVKHISIFTLCAIIGVVSGSAARVLPKGSNSMDLLKELLNLNPIVIMVFIISAIILFAYWLMFIHNCLNKFSNLKETNLMPNIDSELITPILPVIPLGIVWTIYNIIGSIIPIFNIFWSIIISGFCMPYVYIAYCKDFSSKGLMSPAFVFKIMGQVFLPTLILSLKFIAFYVLLVIIIFMSFMIIGKLPLDIAFGLGMTLVFYVTYIYALVLAYCQSDIYLDNVYEVNFD